MEIVALFLSLIIVTIPFIVLGFIAITTLAGAPYKATSEDHLKTMLALAKITKKDICADIGAGDGRLVRAMAKQAKEAHGYEVNPLLVLLGRKRIRDARLEGKAFMHFKNFWQQDLSSFSVVTVYGTPHIMGMLEKKLLQDLPKKARVVSNVFKFPTWQAVSTKNDVRLYRVS